MRTVQVAHGFPSLLSAIHRLRTILAAGRGARAMKWPLLTYSAVGRADRRRGKKRLVRAM